MRPAKRRRSGCLSLFLLLLVGIAIFAWFKHRKQPEAIWQRMVPRETAAFGEDEMPRLTEIWSEGQGTNKVVRIPISGMILLREESPFFPSASSTELALRAIRRATHDPAVRALILDIDSGGGGITASDILFEELQRFRRVDPNRRIVAICGDVAASGAYYIALAADQILTRPTTLTGSIGVLIQTLNVHEFARRHGIRDVTIKSGENKDLLNPLEEISPAQLAILQDVIEAMHRRFIDLVATQRNLAPEVVAPLADGRIFTAEQALAHGLIDGIGYWADAVQSVRTLLDVPDVIIFRYEATFSWRQLMRAAVNWRPHAWLDAFTSPRLQYRWDLN